MKKYIHYGSKEYIPQIMKPIKNDFLPKPQGGLWASSIDATYSWKRWCDRNKLKECTENNSFYFALKEDARILYINSVSDLDELPKIKNRHKSLSGWVELDFEELAKKYDAIEVCISNDYGLYHALYGWDCDSIVVMNPDVVIVVND